MNFDHLEYFITLANCKQFTEAAECLHLSQSSLSKHIKSLETEFNAEFFVRESKGCELTSGGEIFYKFAVDSLKNKRNLEMSLNDNMKKHDNRIKLGSMPVITEYKICEAISDFMDVNRNIDMVINESSDSYELRDKLIKGDINMLITVEGFVDNKLVDEIRIKKDYIVLLVSKDNPISKKSTVSLADLANETLITLDENTGLTEFLIYHHNQYHIKPKMMSGYITTDSILSLVKRNLGVTLLWKSLVEDRDLEDLVEVNLQSRLEGAVVLAVPCERKLSSAEKDFKEHIKQYYLGA